MFFALLPVNTRLLISPTRCLQALRSNKRWSRSGLRKAWKFPVADISRLMNIRFSEYFWVSVPTPILGKRLSYGHSGCPTRLCGTRSEPVEVGLSNGIPSPSIYAFIPGCNFLNPVLHPFRTSLISCPQNFLKRNGLLTRPGRQT